MKKMYLLMFIVFACGLCTADKKENVQHYYDNSSVVCSLRLPKNIKADKFLWQLSTPRWRVMARGRIAREAEKNIVKVPLKFDTLKPGINLKCILALKVDGVVVVEQKIVVYSRKIFKHMAGRLKNAGAGAVLPEDEIAELNILGLELPERPLDNFEDPAFKVIFCSAKKYLDNVDMLGELMKRGITLVMFAPDDESEIFLPVKDFLKISLISSKEAKTKGALGVICNKEKIAVACASGEGGLIRVEYKKGKIIIIADPVKKALTKIPDAALLLKENLTK